jgi:hypothetical protein
VLVRFDLRSGPDGWTIFDRTTGEPAVVDGFVAEGLPLNEADDLVDLLNTLHLLKQRSTLH